MIDYVSGNIEDINPTSITVDVNGVGYQFNISLNTFTELQNSKKAKVFVEQVYIRDDMPKYYGFSNLDERVLFSQLLSVSGVGGSSALLMLSSLSSQEIIGAVNTANVGVLKSIKGIGEKTAQRIENR